MTLFATESTELLAESCTEGRDLAFRGLGASNFVTGPTRGPALLKNNEVMASWFSDNRWLNNDTGSTINTFICISVLALKIQNSMQKELH